MLCCVERLDLHFVILLLLPQLPFKVICAARCYAVAALAVMRCLSLCVCVCVRHVRVLCQNE